MHGYMHKTAGAFGLPRHTTKPRGTVQNLPGSSQHHGFKATLLPVGRACDVMDYMRSSGWGSTAGASVTVDASLSHVVFSRRLALVCLLGGAEAGECSQAVESPLID